MKFQMERRIDPAEPNSTNNTENNIPTNQESKENRKKTLEVKIGESTYSIETESYDFEYPKNIQEETGIVGYERTKINKENIEAIKEQIEMMHNDQEKSFAITKSLYALLDSLSNNEYPSRCHNHKLNYWAADQETADRYKEYFKESFFKNKIYDLSLIKKEKEKKLYPFSNASTLSGENSEKHANITVYDAQSHKRISPEQIPLGDVLQYKDSIENGTNYAVTAFGGLNFVPSDFFQSLNEKEICFGYSFKLDRFMREYYEKSLCELMQVSDYKLNNQSAIREVGTALLLDNLLNIEDSSSNEDPNFKTDLNFILEKANIEARFLETELEEMYSTVEHYLRFTETKNREYGLEFESYLPIFIGDKEIPQLSWGHAKYAHYFNENGFNFFKFKHAEHLPKKVQE